MVEDLITARVVFDKGGVGGLGGGGPSGGLGAAGAGAAGGGLAGSMGKIAGGVAAGLAIFAGMKLALDKLAKASPALQASLNIMGKAISIPLRIIGDVVNMFMRPLAIAMLRDMIPLLRKWRDFKTSDLGKGIGEGVEAYLSGLEASPMEKLIPGSEFLNDYMQEQFENVDWDQIKEDFDTALAPIWDSFETFIEIDVPEFFKNSKKSIEDAWKGWSTWWDENVAKPIMEGWTSMVTWLDDNVWQPLKDGFAAVVNWVIDQVNKIPMINIGSVGTGGGSSGRFSGGGSNPFGIPGNVPEPVGDLIISGGRIFKTAKEDDIVAKPNAGSGGMGGFSPNITINATINNDSDLQRLADKLVDMVFSSSRRRVSYTPRNIGV